MRTLNKQKPYGTVHGRPRPFGATHSQDGALFGPQGNCVAITINGELEAYDAKVHDNLPAEEPTAKQIETLQEAATEVAKLEADVKRLEGELDAAKNGDINSPDYTSTCANLQKQLTAAKRELQKAINRGAALESPGAPGKPPAKTGGKKGK